MKPLLFSLLILASSEAAPFPKHGPCPAGFYDNGTYCVPTPGAAYAIPKVGPCPSGFMQSGNACLQITPPHHHYPDWRR